jgi:putative transposase
MARGLVRYQTSGDTHFLTFSCFRRQPHLGVPSACKLFERSLEAMRLRYDFQVFGYVVMPEHVHLLVTEPKKCLLSKAIQALKLSVAVQREQRPFWQARYYDFNVFTTQKHIEKLKYIHRKPVTRGLVEKPEEWPWSSYSHYVTGAIGTVEIESWWTGTRKASGLAETHIPVQQPEIRPGPTASTANLHRKFK